MASWKILVLVHQDLIPPEKFESKDLWAESACKTEYDVVSTLKKMGHRVEVLGVRDELLPIRESVDSFKPKIVFNLLEEFAGEAIYDQNVVSYLELLKVKYTGACPRALMLARDKALAKKILIYHRLPTPKFWVFRRGRKIKAYKGMTYPLFVKSLNEEASMGITQKSIVNDEEQLCERVAHIHEACGTDALVEQYIEGRELYVSCLGNGRVTVFPIWELRMDQMADSAPKIATSKVKWDFAYRKKYGIRSGLAKGLSEEVEEKVKRIAKRVYRALDLNGYARLDMRLTEDNEVYLIEANPNPDIGDKEDFADSAMAAGVGYAELLQKILRLGL